MGEVAILENNHKTFSIASWANWLSIRPLSSWTPVLVASIATAKVSQRDCELLKSRRKRPVWAEAQWSCFLLLRATRRLRGTLSRDTAFFTYYLLKEIKDSEGNVSFGDLSDHIISNVSRQAPQLKMRKKQTPAMSISDEIADSWRKLGF